MGLIDSVDTMILGANAYPQSKGYWPYVDQGEYGEKLINLTKFHSPAVTRIAPTAPMNAPGHPSPHVRRRRGSTPTLKPTFPRFLRGA